MRISGIAGLSAALLVAGSPAFAQMRAGDPGKAVVAVSADELLAVADRALAAGDVSTAETAYRALFADPSVEVRSEGRFRLAMLFVRQNRLVHAAVLFREILDEQPHAQRVRLELARVLDLMGDETGARRALREAQAGGLPPDVARLVDRYSAALRAQKSLGGSLDIALAPDSNINRATRSPTLATVLGEFELDADAKERSGVGLALRGQGYARVPLGRSANLFGRLSSSADLYREARFNDVALGLMVGPELRIGSDRLSLEAGGLWRWYGGRTYSGAATISLNYVHPLGRQAQLRGTASLALVDNRNNALQDGRTYWASLAYERAISERAGLGATLSVDRQALRSPGYASWAGQASFFAYRELGPVTLVATISYGRLEADERLLLFPDVRADRTYRVSLAATFRNLRIGTFAPFVRVTRERNRSSVKIYDYRRIRAELGLSRAF